MPLKRHFGIALAFDNVSMKKSANCREENMPGTTKTIMSALIITLTAIVLMRSDAIAGDKYSLIDPLNGKAVNQIDNNNILDASLAAPKFKSEATAACFSVLGTFIPIIAGAVALRGNSESTVPIVMMLSGVAIGPSLGYFYGGCPGRGATGIGIRVALGVLTAVGSTAAYNSGNETIQSGEFMSQSASDALAVGIIGGAIITIDMIVDMASVKRSVREANQKLLQSSYSLAPTCLGQAKTPGLELTLRF